MERRLLGGRRGNTRAAGQVAQASMSPRDLATGLHCTTWSVVGAPVATCPLGVQEPELMSPLCSLLPLRPLSRDTQVRTRAEGWSRERGGGLRCGGAGGSSLAERGSDLQGCVWPRPAGLS